jgi:N-acetylmuramic acid 6-phosphate etherase
MNYDPNKLSSDFLKISPEFKLGHLPTEQRHKDTMRLSELAKSDLHTAIDILKNIDLSAIDIIKSKIPQILKLRKAINDTLNNNKCVYFCGCGSTGRLSISLEVLWRTIKSDHKHINNVIGLMAGGDTALISAIEDFEDHAEFAHTHLKQLGFKNGDLLIASTEGGETPFVIGCVEYALKKTNINPWFVYCNPDEILINTIERSKNIITNNLVSKLNLNTGPMALCGSTRMQASTVIMYALGIALFESSTEIDSIQYLDNFKNFLSTQNYSFLADFIKAESNIYKNDEYIHYFTKNYGITVLTDTAERAPTFNLLPFENIFAKNFTPSKCYLSIENEVSIKNSWTKVLLRHPRVLSWNQYEKTSLKTLYGYDLSINSKKRRQNKLQGSSINNFYINKSNNYELCFSLNNLINNIFIKNLSLLEEHLFLKMLLNIHSTLVMGRMDRYYGNLMTWVKPSCNKLIDRAIRYIQFLAKNNNIKFTYEEICLELFKQLHNYDLQKPIVIKTLNALGITPRNLD